jgi:hypothetical protein
VIGISVFLWRRTVAARLRAANCVASGPSVTYVGWQGSLHVFNFLSERYAELLMESNERKLVNLSAGNSDGDALITWISRVESAKGPAARRLTVEAGLAAIRDDGERARFAEEAGRIEVRATLDKVDALKSKAAKVRAIQEALETLVRLPLATEARSALCSTLELARREADGAAKSS